MICLFSYSDNGLKPLFFDTFSPLSELFKPLELLRFSLFCFGFSVIMAFLGRRVVFLCIFAPNINAI